MLRDKLEHMKPAVQKAVSMTLFGLGAFAGVAGCAIYPMAVFTVGVNDSWQEVFGISLVFFSLCPMCVLALRFPLFAGCSLLFVPCFDIYATVAQRSFMINVRHLPQPPIEARQMIGAIHLVWPYLSLGLFAIITSGLGWPTILNWPRLKRSRQVNSATAC